MREKCYDAWPPVLSLNEHSEVLPPIQTSCWLLQIQGGRHHRCFGIAWSLVNKVLVQTRLEPGKRVYRGDTVNGISGGRNSTLEMYQRGRDYNSGRRRTGPARVTVVPRTVWLRKVSWKIDQCMVTLQCFPAFEVPQTQRY